MRPRQLVFRSVALAGAVVALAACVPPPPAALSPTPGGHELAAASTTTTTLPPAVRLLQAARSFVFRVRSVDCLVTGSSFASSDEIVTNRHVASGSATVQMSTWNGNDFDAAVQSISTGPDLAILYGGTAALGPPLETAPVATGTPVWAAGYPEGNQLSVIPGHAIAYLSGREFGEPGEVIEISNAIKHGNSGGPLLDEDGRVIGVVFALDTRTGDGLAISAATLQSYLNSPGGNTYGGCYA
jgi:S1-C subfamily serine protease